MQLPFVLLAVLSFPVRSSKVKPEKENKQLPQELRLEEAMGTAYDSLDKNILSFNAKAPEPAAKPITVHVAREEARETEAKAKSMPIKAQMSKNDLEEFLGKLSKSCRVQFEKMLEGKGDAKDLHRFGTSEKHMNVDGCKKIGGAICANHAQVKQSVTASDGRKLMEKSDVDGDSCLPKSCIQDPDLKMLASFVQHHAVQALGAASQGQKAPEVRLDVDCSKSGGSSYSAKGSWSMEAGGAGKLHSKASHQWSQGCMLSVLFLISTAQLVAP